MANGQTVTGASANVVVVAADGERREQYEDALRRARIPTRATVEADEAETLLAGLSPDVLVLDRGLPRLVLFRLYGLVREDANEPPVQVLFVGQDGETGPGDHYLPGDPSPSNVADRVNQLLASASAEAPSAQTDDAPSTRGSPAEDAVVTPHGASVEPSRPATQPPATAAAAAMAAGASPAAGAPTTNGVSDDADASATTAVAEDAEAAEPDPDDARKRTGRRLDVILIRVGLVLLILGALLIMIQSDAFPPALVAPGAAPATPTRRPAASPKPGGFLDTPGAPVQALVVQRPA